jgi:hypothetical protein
MQAPTRSRIVIENYGSHESRIVIPSGARDLELAGRKESE